MLLYHVKGHEGHKVVNGQASSKSQEIYMRYALIRNGPPTNAARIIAGAIAWMLTFIFHSLWYLSRAFDSETATLLKAFLSISNSFSARCAAESSALISLNSACNSSSFVILSLLPRLAGDADYLVKLIKAE